MSGNSNERSERITATETTSGVKVTKHTIDLDRQDSVSTRVKEFIPHGSVPPTWRATHPDIGEVVVEGSIDDLITAIEELEGERQ